MCVCARVYVRAHAWGVCVCVGWVGVLMCVCVRARLGCVCVEVYKTASSVDFTSDCCKIG
jgi:hypothetical protein